MGSIVDLEKRARPSWPKELSTNEDKVLNAEEINLKNGKTAQMSRRVDLLAERLARGDAMTPLRAPDGQHRRPREASSAKLAQGAFNQRGQGVERAGDQHGDGQQEGGTAEHGGGQQEGGSLCWWL